MSGPPSRKPVTPRKITPEPLRKLTPAPGRRIDERVPADLPVSIQLGKRRLMLNTADVSHGGMFVLTSEVLDLRQLVRVDLILPSDDKSFSATGWLVHARPIDGNARGAGVGVQFYGVGRDDQERWGRLVIAMRSRAWLQAHPREAAPARGFAVHREFKRDAAHVAIVRVTYGSLNDLRTTLARDIARGALFFAAEATSLVVGDRVGLEIVHPINDDVFEIDGRVRRVVTDNDVRGLEVKIALDEERRVRFEEFVTDPVAESDLET